MAAAPPRPESRFRSNPDSFQNPNVCVGQLRTCAALALGSNVPRAAVSDRSKDSFDHLVGESKQGCGDFQLKRFGGSEIKDQLELGGLHDR